VAGVVIQSFTRILGRRFHEHEFAEAHPLQRTEVLGLTCLQRDGQIQLAHIAPSFPA
jgi:hypothetical protein